MAKTTISWTDYSHNLWWGCVEVSPACDNCYAARDAKRYGHDVWGDDKPRRFFKEAHMLEPLKWQRAAAALGVMRRVFCGSFMDIGELHRDPVQAATMKIHRDHLFNVIVPATPNLIWLFLTKRPWNMRSIVPSNWQRDGWPRNAWAGTTAENQQWYNTRVAELGRLKAANRFISHEPSLGRINYDFAGKGRGITWVIGGGESGAGYRAEEEDDHRSDRDQCAEFGVEYWFKQHSAFHPRLLGDKLDGRQHHGVPELTVAA